MPKTQSPKTNLYWKLYQDDPILKPGLSSPILSDPSFLFPENTIDHKWHLFAHNLFGILHYTSENGIEWSKPKSILKHAMRPFIYQELGTYYLYYEKYKPFHLLFAWWKKSKWESEIQVRTSKDLKTWSEPKTVLKPSAEFHKNQEWGSSVSNPCLVKMGSKYRLYYSSSLEYVKDCGFCEPKYISVAESSSPTGPFHIFSQPIFAPNAQDPFCNLAAGSIKVVPWRDRFLGFQTGIFWNQVRKESCSAVLFLQSEDGLRWDRINDTPILGPTAKGWKASHVYSCDVKYSESEKVFILYFNARSAAHWSKGREAIGLFVGKVEEETLPAPKTKAVKGKTPSKKSKSKLVSRKTKPVGKGSKKK
ncbi:family 43 glycosylhydrolase [Leptospira idonii]|uniref:Glycosyl hydrolase family 43 n=1 Tax=Leptospira idonii TaxID=1193500 RepID=A0A4R9LU87_9LEPT|nr:family 43 glycosylhydrolase [Leptospira idonii]TGN17365.1 glycosyl hydrolase family 43 [Leptospira idonii]